MNWAVLTTTRAGRHSFFNLKEHLLSAQENTLIAVQIEDPEAIERVEEIASVALHRLRFH